MSGCDLIWLVSAIACAIAESCETEELELLAAVFAQLGDSLATYLLAGD